VRETASFKQKFNVLSISTIEPTRCGVFWCGCLVFFCVCSAAVGGMHYTYVLVLHLFLHMPPAGGAVNQKQRGSRSLSFDQPEKLVASLVGKVLKGRGAVKG